MTTIKMKKGDLICNINDSPESINHAKMMGFIPVDNEPENFIEKPAEQPIEKPIEAEKPAEIKPEPNAEQPDGNATQSRRGRKPKSEAEAENE